MPRANRIAPTGERFATRARGTLMGNRGCLVDAKGDFTARRWTTRAWICCRLDFKGRQRAVALPGRWTALFFLDEVTALAAGHRPCGECRRRDLVSYKTALGQRDVPIREIDEALHRARLALAPRRCALTELPDGAMVQFERDGACWLVWRGALHRWTPGGYDSKRGLEPAVIVDIVTPEPSLRALSSGYVPMAHPTTESSLLERAW
jgi:hypothetical protein